MNKDTHPIADTTAVPQARVVEKSKFSLIWVVPLIALVIAAWLVWSELKDRGPRITVTFQDGSGLQAGSSVIKYKGVKVGSVTDIHLSPDLKGVVVQATLDRTAGGLAREGSQFWVVRPEIGFSGVHGLDTLLSGEYLAVRPGDGAPALTFTGLAEPPPPGPGRAGINIILQTDQLGGLSLGSPVYYREFEVGTVDRFKLADDANSVLIHVHISHPYDALVRENSRFWNASGMGMDLGLLGVKVKTESLKALIEGGVAFATPAQDAAGGKPPELATYTLYDKPEDAWLKWQAGISLPEDSHAAGAAPGYFPPSGTPAVHEPRESHGQDPAPPPALPHQGPPGH